MGASPPQARWVLVVGETPSRGMAHQQAYPTLETLRKLEASLSVKSPSPHQARKRAPHQFDLPEPLAARLAFKTLLWRTGQLLLRPRMRKALTTVGVVGGFVLLGIAGLGWRLATGPIPLDVVTPWLRAAITENFGAGHEV